MRRRSLVGVAAVFLAAALGLWQACASAPVGPPELLSAYGLFDGDLGLQRPAAGVLPYDLNTPLFSDYADKLRFIKLPEGATITYREDGVLEFPVGTVIAKTFAYRKVGGAAGGRSEGGWGDGLRLLETRILVREESGWVGLPYVWNEEQTEARLQLVGAALDVEITDPSGEQRQVDYRVPNANQCKGCHRTRGREMLPIGPRIAQLNRDFDYGYAAGSGERVENQLAHWSAVEALVGAPAPQQAPRYRVWDAPSSGSVEERARAWLEINCAHCHNPEGPARTSNLDLSFAQNDPTMLGVRKHPVAAGRGSGDRLYDIVPGEPDRSILIYRMESLDPGVMMPELGRSVVHTESLQLIRQWIEEMPDPYAESEAGP